MSAHAPSESTNPLRSASNGRLAVSGSGFFVSAVIWANAATVSGRVAASDPPTMARSSNPSRIIRYPSPTAWAPDAHADTMQKFGPIKPNAIAMWPAAALAMSAGTMNGLTRPGPFSSRTLCWFNSHSIPPIPVANTTPPRSALISGFPASSQASLADAMEKWTNRSVRRASFTSSQLETSNPSTSPASFTGRSDASNRVIPWIPLRPEVAPAQKASTPMPIGVTGPMPVITTLRSVDTELGGHELDGLPDGLHAVHLLLGDLDVPLLLEGQDGLHEVERVRVQVLREPRVGGHLALVDGQLLRQDLADPSLDLSLVHPSSLALSPGARQTLEGPGLGRLCREPAVHGDGHAVHVGGVVRHQEPDHRGHFLEVGRAPKGGLVDVVSPGLLGQVRGHRGVDQAGPDGAHGRAR